jgi:MurNAc alpha-1-phosphate uridylyltransferase
MKVMILAAGRGERMRPITDHTPKPLIKAGGKSLIERLIRQLRDAGHTDLVINHAWLGEKIESALGDGSALGVSIQWSAESTALETAGGIAYALHYFDSAPFAVVNADICTDFDFSQLNTIAERINTRSLNAVCVLVPNPPQHPNGDFALTEQQLLSNAHDTEHRATFAGIGVYSRKIFEALVVGEPAPLAPILREQADQHLAGGVMHTGFWSDVGTPERLEQVNLILQTNKLST